MAVEVEEAHRRIVADRRQLWRDPGEDRRRPAHDEGGDRAYRKCLPGMRIDSPAGFERRECAVEPAGIGRAGLREAAFEHILPIEMRALAIGGRDGVHDRRLARLVEAMQVGHRRVQREEAVERQGRVRAGQQQCLITTKLSPIRVADGRGDGKAIERAAQNDGQKPRVAALGMRNARHSGPSEQHSGTEQ